MGYKFKRYALPILGQAGVFSCGILSWFAFHHALYATGLLSLLLAATMAGLTLKGLFRPIQRFAPLGQESGFTQELSRHRLQILLDQTPSPLLLQSEDGPMTIVNRAARQVFGTPLAARQALSGSASTLSPLPGQIEWQGQRYTVTHADLDEQDRHSRLVVLTDISAEVRAAEAGALRDLLKVLNHELMNVLTPVASMSRSALDIMRERTEEAQATAITALERVVARTEGLIDFVDAYRVLTRLPAPDLKPVALKGWCEDLAQSFAAQWAQHGVTLEPPLCPPDLRVLMDADQMRLCVSNLLNNAAEAALERPDPHVRLRLTGDVVLTVEDSGPGIEAAQAESVFLPFFTTKPKGSGVGLSLARQILRGHGSEIALLRAGEREIDALCGAAFSFRLERR